METKEYVLELLRNNLWIIPIRGRGQTVDECKVPLSFKEKDEVITWKDKRILGYSEELARRGHHAWAIWLLKSNRFGIDLDLYKAGNYSINNIIGRLQETGLYLERSGRGGLHLIGLLVSDKAHRLVAQPQIPGLEYKHDGLMTVYPTVFKVGDQEYRYEKISGDLLNPMDIDLVLPVLRMILGLERLEIEEAGNSTSTGRIGVSEDKKIEGLKLPVDNLTVRQISVLLYLLFELSGCRGMRKIMERIVEEGVCPVRKEIDNVMRIPRTTRWIVQYIFASVLGYVGVSVGRAQAWMVSWRFIDEDEEPRRDSLYNALLNVYRYQKLFLIPRGGCPVCHLMGLETCHLTPIHRVIKMSEPRMKRLVEFVRKNVT